MMYKYLVCGNTVMALEYKDNCINVWTINNTSISYVIHYDKEEIEELEYISTEIEKDRFKAVYLEQIKHFTNLIDLMNE
jgi:hypothetical protein